MTLPLVMIVPIPFAFIMIIMPRTGAVRQRVQQLGYLEQPNSVGLDGPQHVYQTLFQQQTVGHHQIGVMEKSNLGGRRQKVMGIGAHRQQDRYLGVVTRDIRRDVSQDGGCRRDRQRFHLGSRRLRVRRLGSRCLRIRRLRNRRLGSRRLRSRRLRSHRLGGGVVARAAL